MNEKKRVLILCTGNSARSQMAEGLLREISGGRLEVESAGVIASFVRPQAIEAMKEINIDISGHRSKSVEEFAGQNFDYVIMVCDNAKESCPVFPGDVKRIHWSFDDPAEATGSESEKPAVFRRVRDEIKSRLEEFAVSQNVDGNRNMQTITENDTPFACNMAALDGEQKKRVLDLLGELKAKRQEVRELPDGFAFRYAIDSDALRNAAEFVTYERLCCPFFSFELKVEKDDGAMWLRLKGGEGVKDFIKIEFDI